VANLPFADGYYIDESLPVAAQECVNLFVRKNEITGDLYLGKCSTALSLISRLRL